MKLKDGLKFALAAGLSILPALSAAGPAAATLNKSPLGSIQLQATPGTMAPGQAPAIFVTQSQETAKDFDSTFLGDHKTLRRLPNEIRIRAGKHRPKSPVTLQLSLLSRITAEFLPTSASKPVVTAQFFYESETESHDYFTEIPSSYDPVSRDLKVVVEPKYFTDLRDESGTFEAVLVIVTDSKK